MSFSLDIYQGEAEDYKPSVFYAVGHDRESEVLAVIEKALADITAVVGGHVSVGASGHINANADQPGDTVNLQLTSFLRPSDPTPDTGLEAAGGSARLFPPEASTAAPMTEDNSPPAAQEPIPQPALAGDEVFSPPEVASVAPVELAPAEVIPDVVPVDPDDFKKHELQTAADVLGVEVPSGATKADIAEALPPAAAPEVESAPTHDPPPEGPPTI